MNEIHIAPRAGGYALRLHIQEGEIFKQLIGALKRLVPRFARRFDAGERCWYVDAEATADLEEWLSLAEKRYNVSIVWEPPEEEAGRHHFTGWF